MDTAVELQFGDGTYRFWLPLPMVFEVERKTGKSLFEIEEGLRPAMGHGSDGDIVFAGGGAAALTDMLTIIRCGLIGGNSGLVDGEEVDVGPVLAKHLVETYAYPERPMKESAALAYGILQAAIFGIQLKKKAVNEADENAETHLSQKAK